MKLERECLEEGMEKARGGKWDDHILLYTYVKFSKRMFRRQKSLNGNIND